MVGCHRPTRSTYSLTSNIPPALLVIDSQFTKGAFSNTTILTKGMVIRGYYAPILQPNQSNTTATLGATYQLNPQAYAYAHVKQFDSTDDLDGTTGNVGLVVNF